MKTYKIKVTQIFEFTVDVRADSKLEAKEILNNGFNFPLISPNQKHTLAVNDPSDKDEEGILDWNIPYHHSIIKFK